MERREANWRCGSLLVEEDCAKSLGRGGSRIGLSSEVGERGEEERRKGTEERGTDRKNGIGKRGESNGNSGWQVRAKVAK